MHFFKYHGTGNDFVLIERMEKKILGKSALSKRLCHRRFGVGADGCVFLEISKKADAKMLIFNADGSEASMCGNALRCSAKHLFERWIVEKKRMIIETKAGTREVHITSKNGKAIFLKVDMGRPIFERRKIPARGKGFFIREKMMVDGTALEVSALNTGVPHAVVFVEDVGKIPFVLWGESIRKNKIFKEGANVNFVERTGKNAFRVRTYERGVEHETWACGTGIAASSAMAVILNHAKPEKPLLVEARGGMLSVDVKMKGNEIEKIYMGGKAEFVFEGDI